MKGVVGNSIFVLLRIAIKNIIFEIIEAKI